MKKIHFLLITCFVLFTFAVAFMPANVSAKAEFIANKVDYIDGGTKLKVEGSIYNASNKTITKIDNMNLTVTLFKSGHLVKSYNTTISNINKSIKANASANHEVIINVDSAVQFDNYGIKFLANCTYEK